MENFGGKVSSRLRGNLILKNLDCLNPEIARPRTLASVGALMPFLLGIACLPLALSAAPSRAFSDNFLAIFCAVLSVVAFFFMLIPRIFRWDWRSRYFGTPLIYLGTMGSVGIVPWLSIVLFSSLPLLTRLLLFGLYSGAIIFWCRRFVVYYRHIYLDVNLRCLVYEEHDDAIYYLQQGDKILFEKKLKLDQFPPNFMFLLFMALAFVMTPFASSLARLVGIPFIHIFLTVAGFPITLLCLGMAVRGYLIFYYYPWHLKRTTGKEVYVDMVTKIARLRK